VPDEVISEYMKYFSYEKTGLCCVFMAGCDERCWEEVLSVLLPRNIYMEDVIVPWLFDREPLFLNLPAILY
jgi:hypothetical protein